MSETTYVNIHYSRITVM